MPVSSRRVLVVDDNRDSTETLSLLLRAKGHEAREASSGAEAIAVADDFHPHVVVLDLSLPGMDGYEVATRLREKHGGEMTIVALTGWTGGDVRAKAASAGFDFHLLKPVDWGSLEQVLDSAAART